MKKYQHITIGGTFDHLHIGHKTLIAKAFSISDIVSIAITSDSFSHLKKFASEIEPLEIRLKTLQVYLDQHNLLTRATIFPIQDLYGFALQDSSLEAIVVTHETYKNAIKINTERQKNNLPPLDIVLIPFKKSADNQVISSSRIRAGEIDRVGHLYSSLFTDKKTFVLPDSLRETMRQPLGKIFKNEHDTLRYIKATKPPLVITVGDIVTSTLKKIGFEPDITIVDFRSRRTQLKNSTNDQKNSYENLAGTIQKTAVYGFNKHLKEYLRNHKKAHIFINGEEDLLALPATLFAPLGAYVLYGQFNLGIVLTEVTEEKKAVVRNILLHFK